VAQAAEEELPAARERRPRPHDVATSTSRPTHAALDFALIFCCTRISLRRRASIVRLGTFRAASSPNAAAPSSSE